jgi:hypothetical protein
MVAAWPALYGLPTPLSVASAAPYFHLSESAWRMPPARRVTKIRLRASRVTLAKVKHGKMRAPDIFLFAVRVRSAGAL